MPASEQVTKQRPEFHPIPVSEQIGIDLVGPLPETDCGNKYIITATDYFSKWQEAAPLSDKTAVGVADFLFSIFCRHGWPEIVLSDQGREFVNNELCLSAQMLSIESAVLITLKPMDLMNKQIRL